MRLFVLSSVSGPSFFVIFFGTSSLQCDLLLCSYHSETQFPHMSSEKVGVHDPFRIKCQGMHAVCEGEGIFQALCAMWGAHNGVGVGRSQTLQFNSLTLRLGNCGLRAQFHLLPVFGQPTSQEWHLQFKWLGEKSKKECFMTCESYRRFKLHRPYVKCIAHSCAVCVLSIAACAQQQWSSVAAIETLCSSTLTCVPLGPQQKTLAKPCSDSQTLNGFPLSITALIEQN